MFGLRPPEEIRKLESFGIGSFTDEELQDKCDLVRRSIRMMYAEKPSASIVIPAFNEKKSIVGTMQSIALQTQRDIEVIVVSNGEDYGNATQQIAEQCGARVIHEPKHGIGLARQIGLEEAKAEIVISTDADTLHDKRWAASIVQEGMRESGVKFGFGPVHSLSRRLSRRMFMESHNLTRYFRSKVGVLKNAGLSEANSFYLREAAMDAGGYDRERNFGEGMDMLRRISPDLDAKFFYSEDFAAYPSGRKMDKMSLLTLGTISIRLGLAHVRGKDLALREDEYPHIR